jgi:hypothetical protein
MKNYYCCNDNYLLLTVKNKFLCGTLFYIDKKNVDTGVDKNNMYTW